MTLYDKSNDESWDPGAEPDLVMPVDAAAKPRSVTAINGEAISVRLTRLGVEARLGNQHFLAHLIGIAALESERLEQDRLQFLKSPVFP